MSAHSPSPSHRRTAFHPDVEAVERRDLLSNATLVGLPPVVNEPYIPMIQDQVAPGTKIRVTGLNYGEPGEQTDHNPKVKIRHSGPKFVIITLPSHTYKTPGTYNLTVFIQGSKIRLLQFSVPVGQPD
jgi:hypothetical protein